MGTIREQLLLLFFPCSLAISIVVIHLFWSEIQINVCMHHKSYNASESNHLVSTINGEYVCPAPGVASMLPRQHTASQMRRLRDSPE